MPSKPPPRSPSSPTRHRTSCTPASFSAITGYTEAEVLGTNCRILRGAGTAPEAAGAIRDALARGEQFREILNCRTDGSPFWDALTITPLRDEHGQVTHFVSVQRDINARVALHEQLRFQAAHDQLTGLPNRAALDGHLAKVLDSDGGARPAVVVGLIDLDRFKEVNNALGHEVEDCPFTGYLDSRGGRQDDVQRWHAQQHRADSSSGASRMIVDWLVREIRSGA